MSIALEPIGIINTPFHTKEGMPIQPKGAAGIKGKVVLNKELAPGLADIEGFSHVLLIYHLHKSVGYDLKVIPFLDKTLRGVFSTRAPRRPNPIGVSVVKLIRVIDNILDIENVDMLNETPLLDIKPYIPDFDNIEEIKTGWVENRTSKLGKIKSDNRFK